MVSLALRNSLFVSASLVSLAIRPISAALLRWILVEHVPSAVAEQHANRSGDDCDDQIDHLLSILLRVVGRVSRQRDPSVREHCKEQDHGSTDGNPEQLRYAVSSSGDQQRPWGIVGVHGLVWKVLPKQYQRFRGREWRTLRVLEPQFILPAVRKSPLQTLASSDRLAR